MQPSSWTIHLAALIHRQPALWQRWIALENLIVANELAATTIDRPIFITGLARAGSTLILELLNQSVQTASFAYRDFPFIQTPWFWSHWTAQGNIGNQQERAHKDGMYINGNSPEAMEEMLWMFAFADAHNPNASHLLTHTHSHPHFEKHYRQTIKKLLIAKKGQRYLCKANYHGPRIAYLLKLFPDARIIIPIRHPIDHIGSLLNQHQHFSQQQHQYPSILRYFQQVGHFEFGLDRRPINTGDIKQSQTIQTLADQGKNIEAYAMQWHVLYQHLARYQNHPNILFLRFEDLCQTPQKTLPVLFAHAQITQSDEAYHAHIKTIRPPQQSIHLSDQDHDKILGITEESRKIFAYQ